MLLRLRWLMVPALAVGVWAGDEPWKDKDAAQWSEDEAKQVITDSPWAKMVLPEVAGASNSSRRSGGGGGRGGGGGIGIGGIGIGLPGMGRRGGGGYPGGGGGNPQSGGRPADDSAAPTLTVRWESALPVREAELKAHSNGNPEVDEGHYGIAVYGLPGRMTNGDSKTMADALKRAASIKREGKKDLKPSSVEVIRGEDGPVILYLFPRSVEIVKGDRRMEFDAQIDKLKFEQAFYLEDMVYRGRLEL